MMPKPSDETLIAYLDGELDESVRAEIADQLERDSDLRLRAQRLGESAALLRTAFDPVLREPLPQRLIAAARGETQKVVSIAARLKRTMAGQRRWWIGVPVAASLAGLLIGGGLGFFAGDERSMTAAQEAQADLATGNWLDSIAGYHKLFVNAGSNDTDLADVPPNDGNAHKGSQKLPPDFRLPNLKPWGLEFQGARFLIVEGRPATQLFYTTDNKALGPLTVVVASSTKADLAPTFDHRDDLNLLYWRHHGHAYALVGTANIGYLWNIANDIGWQLDAI
jgi:anti-sigma factor RsiW